ncbi:hypothetical protein AB0M92_23990 [Streptomyces sp. NPDC051582]|uniref:hypothetical protein n=1 Tax=Streptomyces sp. NPDC051582 TaxID=3155167 RepID=UPI00343BDA84
MKPSTGQKMAFVGELAFSAVLAALAVLFLQQRDWLGYVPLMGCLSFLADALRRRSSWKHQ